jgi:hypothetical protein
LNLIRHDIISFFGRIQKLVALAVIFLCLSISGYSQTNKGDSPAGNKGKLRETRFKTKSRQGDKARTRDVSGRRVRMKNYSSANRASANYQTPIAAKSARKRAKIGDNPGRPMSPIYGSSPRNNQNPWKGGPFGGRIRSATEQAKHGMFILTAENFRCSKRCKKIPMTITKRRK